MLSVSTSRTLCPKAMLMPATRSSPFLRAQSAHYFPLCSCFPDLVITFPQSLNSSFTLNNDRTTQKWLSRALSIAAALHVDISAPAHAPVFLFRLSYTSTSRLYTMFITLLFLGTGMHVLYLHGLHYGSY